MKNLLDFVTSKAIRIAGILNTIIDSSFGLIENIINTFFDNVSSFANTGVKVLICVVLYKVAFEGLLTGIF